MNSNVRIQLSVMMFLQYFVWGAWYVTMGTYLLDQQHGLGYAMEQMGRAYNAAPLAAIISPFFVGMIADRFFATEKILAVLHLAGTVVMYYLSTLDSGTDFKMFYLVLMIYTLCYMPTLALTNSISFHNMKNPELEFPGIRVLGTIGWIASSALVGVIVTKASGGFALDISWIFGEVEGQNVQPTRWPMVIASGSSLVLGLFCFFLPHTPPKAQGQKVTVKEVLGLEALSLMKKPSFAVFVIGSFLVCWPLQFYYAGANAFLNSLGGPGWESVPIFENAATKQSLGQVSEIVFMLLMPFFFRRLGVKMMLLVGMLAWTIRYFLFAYGDSSPSLVWMLYGGILLHGICYDFFFVTGQIYVDKKAPRHIRASAQGFITLVTLGLGLFVGSEIFAWTGREVAELPPAESWHAMWIRPAVFAGIVMVLFALVFKDDPEAELKPETEPAN